MENALLALIDHPDCDEGTDWTQRDYMPREVIVKEKERHGRVFIIEEGTAKVVVSISVAGEETQSPKFCSLGPGEVFGELSLFDDAPSSATIQAVDDCHVYAFNALRLRGFLDTHPDLGYQVLNQLYAVTVERLRQANDRVSRLIALGLGQAK